MQNNIYYICQQIFRQEPQESNSIQLNILNQNEPSILYEILCIMLCECLQFKLPNIIQNNHNVERFIFTIRQYFQSFNFDLQYELLDNYSSECYRFLPFQVNKIYFFGIKCEFLYYDFFIPYEPGIHQSSNLNDYHICIKLENQIYRVTFKHFI